MLEGRLPGYCLCGGSAGSSVPKASASACARQLADRFFSSARSMKSAGTDVRALVQQLVERMLAHRAFRAPQDRRGGVVHRAALAVDALAVRFHLELLQVGGQQAQRVRVRQHRVGRRAEEVRVPHADQRHQRRHVLLQRRLGEMAIDVVRRRAGNPRSPPSRSRRPRRSPPPTRPRSARRPSPTSAGSRWRRTPWPLARWR